jgi:hypothetical protein
MASLKRQWTLQLQTDLAGFRRAFERMIVPPQTDWGIEYIPGNKSDASLLQSHGTVIVVEKYRARRGAAKAGR